jgi:hypothetical protein
MHSRLAAGALALAALAGAAPLGAQTDTTVAVRAGARLDVENFGGTIVVKTWDRAQVHVVGTHSRRDRVRVRGGDDVVRVSISSSMGPSGVTDLELTVPATMALNLGGTYTDISVEGTRAPITASTVQGDVIVKGGRELVRLKSVQGRVRLEGARGRVELTAVNKGIAVADVVGDVTAETVNGGISFDRMDSENVDAGTVNGNISYDGTIKDGGIYSFRTHNGGVTVLLPDRPNVTVTAASMEGRVASDFPYQLPASSTPRRRQTFQLGGGSARLEMESFSGTLRLRRRSDASARPDD